MSRVYRPNGPRVAEGASVEITLPASGAIAEGTACVVDGGALRPFDPAIDDETHGVARSAPVEHVGRSLVTIVRAGRLALASKSLRAGAVYADSKGAPTDVEDAGGAVELGRALDDKTLDVELRSNKERR